MTKIVYKHKGGFVLFNNMKIQESPKRNKDLGEDLTYKLAKDYTGVGINITKLRIPLIRKFFNSNQH